MPTTHRPRRPAGPPRPAAGSSSSSTGRPRESTSEPRLRRGTVRVGTDIAWRIRSGHPWLFRDVLGNRPLREQAGDPIDIVDQNGSFVARGLFDPTGPIAVRVFTRDPNTILEAQTIRRRVEQARRLRERFIAAGTTAYRVIHGEGDGLPAITVDRYGDYLVAHLYSASCEPIAEALYDALVAVWKPKAIYAQHRFRPQTGDGPRAPGELVRGDAAPPEVEVHEGGLAFAVDVTAPLGTGLFLDLRAGRQAMARYVSGRRVLNLFSYTGAFSLHAAHAGASEVVSVDLSSKAHGRARRNLQINKLSEQGHDFVVGDAIKVLARMEERKRRFDVVIIDPPSFSQTKGGPPFSAQKDYRDLVAAALTVLETDGILACASNTAKLSIEEFDRILGDGASASHRSLKVIERLGLPPDFPVPAGFPEGHYLKFEICVS